MRWRERKEEESGTVEKGEDDVDLVEEEYVERIGNGDVQG